MRYKRLLQALRPVDSNKDLARYIHFVELGSKTIFTVAGISFVIGLLIINSHLQKYGIHSSAFLKTEFVTAGALWIFLVSFASIELFLLAQALAKANEQMKEKMYGRAALLILLALTAYIGIFASGLYILSDNKMKYSSTELWVTIVLFFLTAWHGSQVFEKLRAISKSIGKTADSNSESYDYLSSIAYGLVVYLAFISSYAHFSYPHLSPVYGGGKAETVMLFPTDANTQIIKKLQLPWHGDSIGPVKIIFESQDDIYLVPAADEKRKAIRIRKDMIQAVVVESTEKNEKNQKQNNKIVSSPQTGRTQTQTQTQSIPTQTKP